MSRWDWWWLPSRWFALEVCLDTVAGALVTVALIIAGLSLDGDASAVVVAALGLVVMKWAGVAHERNERRHERLRAELLDQLKRYEARYPAPEESER